MKKNILAKGIVVLAVFLQANLYARLFITAGLGGTQLTSIVEFQNWDSCKPEGAKLSSLGGVVKLGGGYLKLNREPGLVYGIEVAVQGGKVQSEFKTTVDPSAAFKSITGTKLSSNQIIMGVSLKERYRVVACLLLGWQLSKQTLIGLRAGMSQSAMDYQYSYMERSSTKVIKDINKPVKNNARGYVGGIFVNYRMSREMAFYMETNVNITKEVTYALPNNSLLSSEMKIKTKPIMIDTVIGLRMFF